MSYVSVMFVLIFLYLVFREVSRWSLAKKRKPSRVLITERFVKIVHNPIEDKWMWTKFNPKSRTWEWKREATQEEVEMYADYVFNEIEGDQMLEKGEITTNG